MGEAVGRGADVAIVTNDNPRSEDPARSSPRSSPAIAGEGSSSSIAARPSSGRSTARSRGDVVLIAGKGHEQGQQFGSTVLPFDDRAVALDVLGAVVP